MPWKGVKDPYKIWVSEIILQQTQVSQGIPYYNRFLKAFPTVMSLANSPVDSVLALWTGLGYYSRARNLHKAAVHIVEHHNGKFPKSFEEIKELPGIGDYTASAISSFAYGLPYAVVDANVIRIIARYYGIEEEIHTSKVRKQVKEKTQALLTKKKPAAFNQAIMDFGATVCKPKEPLCEDCVMSSSCIAFSLDKVALIPRKKTKKPRRDRYFHYLEIIQNKKLIIRQRGEKDIWHSLYELPYLETNSKRSMSKKQIESYLKKELGISGISNLSKLDKSYKQTLSHQFIHGIFYKVHLKEDLPRFKAPYLHVTVSKLKKLAIPKLIDWYIG